MTSGFCQEVFEMITKWRFGGKSVAGLVLSAGLGLAVGPLAAAQSERAATPRGPANVSCEMTFTMKGWSAIVSKAEGKGVVTCDNGQRADVALAITGGGLTFGKTAVDDGKGVFSKVTDISEIFGPYGQAEASAGAVDSVSAQALTKGNVSLAVTTKGRGWSLGVSGAKFSIAPAKVK
jgi:hypothetical protein